MRSASKLNVSLVAAIEVRRLLSVAACLLVLVAPARGEEIELQGRRFTLPDGFEIELIASPPLIERPISADFDEQGRLYVTESNGSNEDVQIQLEKKPHRVVRLEDTDGDGRYDKSITFADRLAFPEGALWHAGSLYVAAPPEIWKLTDANSDGVAERREVWFDGKTLGHCANDLHGPFLGLDGWIYWCKGAFAEQTYEQEGRPPLVTRASHMFRRHPRGGWVETVMTGGMDNPVEVAFTPGGERIFSTTFLVHPGGGRRDGLIHALYGGVYGKQHSVLQGHPRTGDLLPPLVHLGAAAPCGLTALESSQLGDGYSQSLLCCSFNMHKITRHQLRPAGGSFQTTDSDFLVCDDLDFHPTDVLEDADGSLVIVDTGGWYKLCCPTSQLYKPDVPGGIYRVRRRDQHRVADPRGLKIDWTEADAAAVLAGLLADPRPAVRKRAREVLAKRGNEALTHLEKTLVNSPDSLARCNAIWTLTRIDADSARRLVRDALRDPDELVRQAAAHSVAVHRDQKAQEGLGYLLRSASPHNRRVAAEAFGRLREPAAVTDLLAAAQEAGDRAVEHSLIYALIEIGDTDQPQAALTGLNPRGKRAAAIALDQLNRLEARTILPWLADSDATLRETAWWLAGRHPQWAPHLADHFRQQLREADLDAAARSELSGQLARFSQDASIQSAMAQGLELGAVQRDVVLEAMASSGLETVPESWSAALQKILSSSEAQTPDRSSIANVVNAVHGLARKQVPSELGQRLKKLAEDTELPVSTRLKALAVVAGRGGKDSATLSAAATEFACSRLRVEDSPVERGLATDILASAQLSNAQMRRVAVALAGSGPMEWKTLLPVLAASGDSLVAAALLDSLAVSQGGSAFDPDELAAHLSKFDDAEIQASAQVAVQRVRDQNRDKLRQMEAVLELLETADSRRGQRIFQGSKAACSTCHQMGYLGGNVGPDLSRIGGIRSRRDLLEAVMFPSASFVRSYEPVSILTVDGLVYNGVLRDETESEVVLALDAQKVVRIEHTDIEERQPGKTSIMPSGLDKQFTPQELADLILFLKVSR